MQLILGTRLGSQNIKVSYQHPSIVRKQLVLHWQARLSVLHLNQEEEQIIEYSYHQYIH